ncbi:hypothetical protein Mgra_00000376 [Meloidogyne graminicola]|uniref:Uncharacterized protein n=1 Tax=Meloidogyne graminicola TaxID=189291 RepID=A0A8T0A3N3_9BILA|nr:hypothetical protein Mgra_00000376 [Meloidogyne graminicola]
MNKLLGELKSHGFNEILELLSKCENYKEKFGSIEQITFTNNLTSTKEILNSFEILRENNLFENYIINLFNKWQKKSLMKNVKKFEKH